MLKTLTVILACSWAAVLADASLAADKYVVPVSPGSSGFGTFREGTEDTSAAALVDAFGEPDSTTEIGRGTGCRLRWKAIGAQANLTNYGQDGVDPCTEGYFYEAILTGPKWHTTKGLRVGSSEAAARKASKRTCTVSRCGRPGYAIELHRIDCATVKVPGVIVQTRSGKVSAFVVRSRGCE